MMSMVPPRGETRPAPNLCPERGAGGGGLVGVGMGAGECDQVAPNGGREGRPQRQQLGERGVGERHYVGFCVGRSANRTIPSGF